MIAGDHRDGGAGLVQAQQRVLEQLDRGERRDRPVVHVTGDEHRVDRLGADDRHQVVDECLLRGAEIGPVQRTSEMPIGRVEQAHTRTV